MVLHELQPALHQSLRQEEVFLDPFPVIGPHATVVDERLGVDQERDPCLGVTGALVVPGDSGDHKERTPDVELRLAEKPVIDGRNW